MQSFHTCCCSAKFWKSGVWLTGGGAAPATTGVKTVPVQPEPVPEPEVKPVQNTPRTVISTSSPSKGGAPPLAKTELGLSPSASAENPPKPNDDSQKSPSFPSSSLIKIPPPLITPKPQSPVNVVSPMTKTPPILPPPPVTTPLTPTKPVVPTYVPVTSTVTPRMAPTPIIFSPQVLQTSSLSPFVDGTTTPTRGTPSGRVTPSTGLRQGIPQKPYTFLDEKARWGVLDPSAGLIT